MKRESAGSKKQAQVLKAPFPYFGGKSRVAGEIWKRFGRVDKYIEPFAGSLATLLACPVPSSIEIVNDLDAYVSNFWRAVQAAPRLVAKLANWPLNELDLHARHDWQFRQDELVKRLLDDPTFFDARLAAWWVWGMSGAIGGSWQIDKPHRSIPNVTNSGTGVHRRSLKVARGTGTMQCSEASLLAMFAGLSDRLRYVRVCCGDWSRLVKPSIISEDEITGVLLDPPYAVKDRSDVYGQESRTIAQDVARWAVEMGDRKHLRIALCGYEGEHDMPASWECLAWKANGGFGNQRKAGQNVNRHRERVWFSPHCLP